MKRRIFLQNTGITLAGLSVIPLNLRCTAKSPNSLINVGMIGTGSHGTSWNLKNYLKYPDLCRVVAVCDVSLSRAKNAQKLVNDSYKTNDCKVYQDFRELLEDESIDAVQISTPDHWHVPISITFYHFRWFDAFSGGLLTDWGAHYCDTAQLVTGNDTSGPIEIVPAGETLYYDNGVFNTAYQFDLQYKYPDNVTMQVKSGNASIRLEGDEGWVESVNWRGKLTASKDNIPELNKKKIELPTNADEHKDFLESIRDGKKTVYPAELGHRLSTLLHCGNIALKLNRKVEWDPKNESFVNNPEAEKFRRREMREKWSYKNICPDYKY